MSDSSLLLFYLSLFLSLSFFPSASSASVSPLPDNEILWQPNADSVKKVAELFNGDDAAFYRSYRKSVFRASLSTSLSLSASLPLAYASLDNALSYAVKRAQLLTNGSGDVTWTLTATPYYCSGVGSHTSPSSWTEMLRAFQRQCDDGYSERISGTSTFSLQLDGDPWGIVDAVLKPLADVLGGRPSGHDDVRVEYNAVAARSPHTLQQPAAVRPPHTLHQSAQDGIDAGAVSESDVLLLQLAGECVWQVCLPFAASDEDAVWLARLNRSAVTAFKSGLNCTSYSLAAGDSLYVPPGVQHSSEPGPASALWAKVVLHSPGPTWVEMLQKVCFQLPQAQSVSLRNYCAKRIARLSETIPATDREVRLLHEAAEEGRFRLQSPLALTRRVQNKQMEEVKAALRAAGGQMLPPTSTILGSESDLFTALRRVLDEAGDAQKGHNELVRRRRHNNQCGATCSCSGCGCKPPQGVSGCMWRCDQCICSQCWCSPGFFRPDQPCSACRTWQPSAWSGPNNQPCTAWRSCDPGYYVSQTPSGSRNRECRECGPDTYTDQQNAGSCKTCPAGKYAHGSRNTGCQTCPSGTFSSGGSGCTQYKVNCQPGEFVYMEPSPTSDRQCRPCNSGQYSTETNGRCISCTSGTYQDQQGQTGCKSCLVKLGQYQPYSGTASCNVCQVGKYPASPTKESCSPCFPGSFSTGRQASCTACPQGKFSGMREAGSCDDCPVGYTPFLDEAQVTLGANNCKDITAPILTVAGGVTQVLSEIGLPFPYPTITASDTSGQAVAVIRLNDVDIALEGRTIISWEGTDAQGNKATVAIEALIIDSSRPVIELRGKLEQTWEALQPYVDPGATIMDTLDGDLTARLQSNSTFLDVSKKGRYIVLYTMEGLTTRHKMASPIVRFVTVVDTTPPVISLLPYASGRSGYTLDQIQLQYRVDTFQDPGATAVDTLDGELTSRIIIAVRPYNIKPDLNTFGPREHCEERSAFQSNDFNLATRTAGVLTTLSAVNASVNVGTLFDVIYSVEDAAGNLASSSRLVLVVDTKAPRLQLQGASRMLVPFGTAFTELGFVATDESEDELTTCVATVVQPAIDVHWPRTTSITYTVSDRYSNTAEIVREVDVTPFELPPPGHTVTLTLNVPLSQAPEVCALQEWLEATLEQLHVYVFLVGRHSGDDQAGAFNLTPNNTLATQGAWAPSCRFARRRRRIPTSIDLVGANVTVLEVVARSKSTLSWLRDYELLAVLKLASGLPIAAMGNITLLHIDSDTPSVSTSTSSMAIVPGAVGAVIAIIGVIAMFIAYHRRKGKSRRVGTGSSHGRGEGTGTQVDDTQVGVMHINSSFGDWAVREMTGRTSATSMTAPSSAEQDDAQVQFGPLLGRFHSGGVYQALFRDTTTKKPRTCLALMASKTEKAMEAERRVHALLADVPSPHVLALIWQGSMHSAPLLLFESVSAGDLLSFLRTLRADWQRDVANADLARWQNEVSQLAAGVALAGQALAQAGIVHNNICARSFVVNRHGPSVDSKICDFAFATTQHDVHLVRKGSSMLSPGWRAPEVLAGGVGSPAADVWSLGVTLWEVLTLGATPYPRAGADDIRAYLKARKRLSKPEICTALLFDTVLLQAWWTSPAARPTAAVIANRLCEPSQILIKASTPQFDDSSLDGDAGVLQRPVCSPQGHLTWCENLAEAATSLENAHAPHNSGLLSTERDESWMAHNPVYQSPEADNLNSSWMMTNIPNNPTYAQSHVSGGSGSGKMLMVHNPAYGQNGASYSSVASASDLPVSDETIYSTPLGEDLFSSC